MQTSSKRAFDLRQFTATIAIWLLLPLAGAWAAWSVYEHVLYARPAPLEEDGLDRLIEVLPGAVIEVPQTTGLWLDRRDSAEMLVIGGKTLGRPEQVNLCEQRTLSRETPERLYPILVRAGWPDIAAALGGGHKLRHPVVLPAAVRGGFPKLDISGEAGELSHAASLRLQAAGAAAGWALVSDVPSLPAANFREMAREAWLLWRSPVADKVDSGVGSQRYAQALRIQRLADPGCAAGLLRLSLYEANATPATVEGKVAVMLFPALGGKLEARLPPGSHRIPARPAVPIEDRALFETAVTRGLIHLGRDGRVEIAPVDLAQALLAGSKPVEWAQARMDESDRGLLKRLYTKADGAYVRQQIQRYNQQSRWAAIRIRASDEAQQTLLAGPGVWQARVGGLAVPLAPGLPAVASRLFAAPPEGWSAWLKVAAWPELSQSAADFTATFSFTPRMDLQSLDVLVLGNFGGAQGVAAAQATPACFGPACSATSVFPGPGAQLTQVRLTGLRAEVPVTLSIRPDTRFAALARGDAEFNPIRVVAGRLRWVQSPRSRDALTQPARVAVQDRAGVPLFQDGKPTDAAREANLTALAGLSTADAHSLAGVLGRLGEQGRENVTARLSIDLELQRSAQVVVDCVGYHGKVWDATTRTCTSTPLDKDAAAGAGRRAGLLILDAGSGEILAAAGSSRVPEHAETEELLNFDRFRPSASPLRQWNWQQDGGLEHAPGSTFKLVTALGLEAAARRSTMLNALLEGRSAGEIDAQAAARGYSFAMKSPCYPAPCGGGTPKVMNFREHRPLDYARDGRFGLREALSNSLNTWFAWLAEQSDATLAGQASGGQPDAHPLGGTALDDQRPIFAIAHRLGFGQGLPLDGGLLPGNFRWQAWDALRAMPSQFDPIHDRHSVRQHAIGLRAQVTPLQLALVAAAIGEGRVIRPRLLNTLDGHNAESPKGEPLEMRLDRIRTGMSEVVKTGTAASAFHKPGLEALRAGVYGKTGTAPMPHLGLNTAWFVGYIEPGTFPGETRRLAFAAWVNRTSLTGGSHAAPMLAAWMEAQVRAAR